MATALAIAEADKAAAKGITVIVILVHYWLLLSLLTIALYINVRFYCYLSVSVELYSGLKLDDQDPKLLQAAVKMSKDAGNKAFQEQRYNGIQ